MEQEEQIFPASFFCPLTQELMKDPVVDPEGNSYERSAIVAWLEKNPTSPITRSPLKLEELIPNRALKDAIAEKSKDLGDKKPIPEAKVPEVQKQKKEEVANNNFKTTQGDVTVTVTSKKNAKIADEEYVLVKIQPPEGKSRTPSDICCVVDISGSMGNEATMKNTSGEVEKHGLSLLDITKHAVKTIISTLQAQDRFALVVYSATARTVFKLTPMEEQAKAKILKEVEELRPDDTTNLWDGLHTGLELLREDSTPDRLSALLLLTDGLPNISPPRGELPMLKKYRDQYQLNCTINTFGFGYDINSELLRDIAIEGDGMYSFIPDSSFVGTTFIHALGNLLTTMAKRISLALEPLNGAKIIDAGVLGGHVYQTASWGIQLNLCSLQFGQSKDIVVRMTIPDKEKPYLSATLKYEPRNSHQPIECNVEAVLRDGDEGVDAQRYRLQVVDTIRQGMELMKGGNTSEALQLVKNLIGEIQAFKDPNLVALTEDLKGQVIEAFSRPDWYKKWGRHYLPSLMRAHLLQQCNNFKDPGIQNYGGKLFQTLRDEVDAIFVKLPPPKPSVAKTTYNQSGKQQTTYNPPVSMARYHSRGNPCFAPNCSVLLADGTEKEVMLLQKGDLVASSSGKSSEVLCVVKTLCKDKKEDLVQLEGGLLITPYHPVRVGGKWHFPCELGEVVERSCPAVYSFVLKDGHVVTINGVECVTLGHNFQEDVVRHPFFGSQLVVEDLQKKKGWRDGLVQLASGCAVRDDTGLICGLRESACNEA